jgi:putative transposase
MWLHRVIGRRSTRLDAFDQRISASWGPITSPVGSERVDQRVPEIAGVFEPRRDAARSGGISVFASVNRVVDGAIRIENHGVQRYQSYKFELKPNGGQQGQMRRIAGCCRFVFNQALALQIQRREQGQTELVFALLKLRLAEWRRRPESTWLANVPIGCLQQALRNLQRAYARYNSRQSRFPRFKKRDRSDGFRYSDPNELKLDEANGRILLPGLGWLRYRNSRNVLGRVRNVTVSCSAKKWFVSILAVREVERPIARGPAVGIDMGIVRFATLSDGSFYTPLNSFRRHESALASAQRAFSRKTKYSNNWSKEKSRVQRIYVRIANARRDYLHKISNAISQNHAVVCVEDLQVSAMSQSEGAHTKRRLNKSILDQGWFEFRRQLEYKLRWNGGRLVAVSPRNTSITCPRCRHVGEENRVSQAQFECVMCGLRENADLVGALNVLRAGHARLACAETSPACEASGQEPTDAFSQDF